MGDPVAVHWFLRDLRFQDNPGLGSAADSGLPVLPVYIHDDAALARPLGQASLWWLQTSLQALAQDCLGHLWVETGDTVTILQRLCAQHNVQLLTLTVDMDPARYALQTHVAKALRAHGVHVTGVRGNLLWDVDRVVKADGTPYRVFTPFFQKGCVQSGAPRRPYAQPPQLRWASVAQIPAMPTLIPQQAWMDSLADHWVPGQAGARQRLASFLADGLYQYRQGRDYPALSAVSRLSPYLMWGELSPHQAWYAAESVRGSEIADLDIDHFQRELGWREFSYSLLWHHPDLAQKNWSPQFDRFPWQHDQAMQHAWQRGQTGVPLVDAGLRELWATGYMHNRVRMVVASFLVKNLLQDWRQGEQWFWDTLVDADPANNPASWQWVAGCGADAAPYFRIFNPVTQAQKFDLDGVYMRRWLPELAALPDKYLCAPWQAPPLELAAADVTLGDNYPNPIVDLKQSRQKALDAFSTLKAQR